ncbi:MAG TPA: 50S ribosomal protein L25 [Kouleothrix sp.]|uniref:50S ribosomal protein L25 n=1 Tax=Kouleothrix sp. TaxID=2779161 RepID=UPI002CFBF62A|nr:50S ribosomal protein L25 [Kouleothrix sp.]HRC76203.1 50S ribosomal protein L25 [Kouleothrix sp.]
MADRITLDLENRTLTGKKVNKLRRAGLLPATVYGKGVGPFTVQLNARTFSDAYRHAGRTGLLDLNIPGQKSVSVFIHSLQRHPVTRAITHVDFLAVDLRIEVTVDVPLHIVGESELVRRGDALLNQVLTSLEVRALPTDIPSVIEIDVSGLDSFDKSIHVGDIVLQTKGEIATPADELVVSLTQTRPEEAEEAEAGEAAAEPELVRETREDEDGNGA